MFAEHYNTETYDQLERTFRDSGASRSECVDFINLIWSKAQKSLRIAFYCLNHQTLLTTLFLRCQSFRDGRIVLILDANPLNFQAVKKLAPMFKKTGNELRIWVNTVRTVISKVRPNFACLGEPRPVSGQV